MKRLTVSVVITAVVGLAAYTVAGAQGQGTGPRSGGPAFERQRGPGPGRGVFALRGLDLTDDQREQIRAIREEERGSGQQPPEAGMQLHRQLQAELFADVPDAQKLTTLHQQITQAQAARLEREIALEQRIAQVLTPEQRAKVRERLSQAPERGRRTLRKR